MKLAATLCAFLVSISAAQANEVTLTDVVAVWDIDEYENDGFLPEAFVSMMGMLAGPVIMDASCSRLKIVERSQVFCVDRSTNSDVLVGTLGKALPRDEVMEEQAILHPVNWDTRLVELAERPIRGGGVTQILKLR